jgi:hypothetical protein
MWAPRSACEALYRLDDKHRLAWRGSAPKSADDLNAGWFVIIQLYHRLDFGTFDDPITFRHNWYTQVYMDDMGYLDHRRVDRGPIFAADGGLIRDWNDDYIPIMVGSVHKGYQEWTGKRDLETRDVFTGRFILTIRSWRESVRDRMLDSAREKGKEVNRHLDDMGREHGKRMWHDALKHTSSGPIIAKKFLPPIPEKRDLSNMFVDQMTKAGRNDG